MNYNSVHIPRKTIKYVISTLWAIQAKLIPTIFGSALLSRKFSTASNKYKILLNQESL